MWPASGARPRPPRSRTRTGDVLLFYRAGWWTAKSGVSAWSATAWLRKDLTITRQLRCPSRMMNGLCAGLRHRLILAKYPKYCSCNRAKRGQVQPQEVRTFPLGPGRNRSTPRRNELRTLRWDRSGEEFLRRLPATMGKVLSIQDKNLIIAAIARRGHRGAFQRRPVWQ